MFTYRLPHEGTWVFLSDPEAIKQVFTGDPRLLHAGEANTVLLPVLGEHSVLLLDEPAHMKERKLMLPPFHGKRMQAYGEVMARGRRGGDRALAGGPPDADAPPDAGHDPRDHPARRLRRRRGGEADPAARRAPPHAQPDLEPRRAIFMVLLGPERLRRFPPFRRKHGARRPAALRGDRRSARAQPTSPSATTSSRCCCRPATRTASR